MDEWTHFFIKNISLTLYSWKGDVAWVWDMSWRWVRTAKLTQSSSNHSSTAFASWLGCSTVGHWGLQDPQSASWFSHRHPLSNWLEPPRAPGYIIVSHPPASGVLPLIYTGASLDWRLGQGSIYNTRTSQKFCNILVVCGSIRQLLMLLPRSCRWWTTLDSEMQSSPDTLRVILTGFASLSTASKSTVLGLPDVTGSLMSLQPWLLYYDQLHLYFLPTKCFWLLLRCYDPVGTHEAKVRVKKLDYIDRSSMRLSNYTLNEMMHNVPAHQLPRCFQPQEVLFFHSWNSFGHV